MIFIQIANYRLWWRDGSIGKDPDFAPLRLKLLANPKLLADVMKSYPGAEDLNTRDCALDWSQLFGSTKWKLDMPSSADCRFTSTRQSELLDSSS